MIFPLLHSSSNSISATENSGSNGGGGCTKTLTRSNSSGVVQEGSPAWTTTNTSASTCRVNSDAERKREQLRTNGSKSETDGGRSSASKESVNLMRSPSYQSTTSAMKNDIKWVPNLIKIGGASDICWGSGRSYTITLPWNLKFN